MTEELTQSDELTTQQAIEIANREAFLVGPPFAAAAFKADGDPMVTLRVTRMIGGVAREFAMGLQLRRSEAEFAEMARKVWSMLLQHAESDRSEMTTKKKRW